VVMWLAGVLERRERYTHARHRDGQFSGTNETARGKSSSVSESCRMGCNTIWHGMAWRIRSVFQGADGGQREDGAGEFSNREIVVW
jgi:hypothetical protein